MRGHVRREGSRYRVVVDAGRDETGKRLRYRPSFATEAEATAAMVKLMGDLLAGTHVDRSALTLGTWLQRWLDDYAALRVTAKTLERYREIVQLHIAPRLGEAKLQKLRGSHLQSYYREKAQTLAPATVRQHHAILRRALEQARRDGLIAKNPALDAEPPKLRRTEARVLTPEEVRLLLGTLRDDGTDFYLPALIAVSCGLRRGEICALCWRDVSLTRGTLHVRRSLEQTKGQILTVKDTKSRSGVRQVMMPASLCEALREHRKAQAAQQLRVGSLWHDHGLVWPDWRGDMRPPDNLSSGFANWMKRKGVPAGLPAVGFHALRHTYASIRVASGASPRDVAAELGHASPAFTMATYAHSMPGASRAAAETMEAVLRGN